jgi:hypothetical protein
MNLRIRDNESLWAAALVVMGGAALVAIKIVINHYYPVTRKFNGTFGTGLICAGLALAFLQALSMNKNPAKWSLKLKGKNPPGRIAIALIGLADLFHVVAAFYDYATTSKLGLQNEQQMLIFTGLLIYMLWLRRYQTNLPNL